MKYFKISIEVNCLLDDSELWPDGDGPKDPTVEDVTSLIAKCGKHHIINDWNLDDAVEITVLSSDGKIAYI